MMKKLIEENGTFKLEEKMNVINYYMTRQKEAYKLLDDIKKIIMKHEPKNQDEINWEHVGDLSSTVDELKMIYSSFKK